MRSLVPPEQAAASPIVTLAAPVAALKRLAAETVRQGVLVMNVASLKGGTAN
jgi:prephenate dehydrogenase